MSDGARQCSGCDLDLRSADFYASSKRVCKACVRARVAKHRAENIESIRAYDRKRGSLQHRKDRVVALALAVQADPVRREHRNAVRAAWSAKHPERRAEIHKRYRAAAPNGFRARRAVSYALETGGLSKMPCEECAAPVAHAHHDDYDKPLDVRWLCPAHHMIWHRDNGPGANLYREIRK